MMTYAAQIVAVIACLIGALFAWLVMRGQNAGLLVRLNERDKENAQLRGDLLLTREASSQASEERERLAATLQAERVSASEKIAGLEQMEARVRDAFDALSARALQTNNQAFLDLARTQLGEFQQAARVDLEARQQSIDQLVKPMQDGLMQVDSTLQAFDRERATSHATLQEHLRLMAQGQQHLAGETQALVTALRAPQARGQWGELQLRRVVELAGMLPHCDFVEQDTVETAEGRLRPDLVVHLPGRKAVIVDSKTPLAAYLDAMDAVDDRERLLHLDRHAKQVRVHVEALATRDYANEYAGAPDFVILFLPGEALFSAACQRDPGLIEFAITKGVIPASPTTLITVLKAVAYGWQQERIAENAEQIRDLAMELYGRLRNFAEKIDKVRRGLGTAVDGFNEAVGSLERRVLPTARRFLELGAASGEDIEVLEPVNSVPRLPAAPELTVVVESVTDKMASLHD